MERFLDPQAISLALEAIESYGYVFIVLGAMLQGVGLPLPAQTILVTAGVMVGQGILNPYYAILFGLVGAIAGSQVGYFVGRRGGRPFVLKVGKYVGITPVRLDQAEHFFDHHGQRAVLVARFIPVLKTFGYIAAGLVKMPYAVFLRNDVTGTAVWTIGSVLLGMILSVSVMSKSPEEHPAFERVILPSSDGSDEREIMAKTFEDLVQEARDVTRQTTPDEVRAALDANDDLTILDVREADEREAAHIPDSKFLPRGLLEYRAAEELPEKEARIVIHCASGGRSVLSVKTLQEMGYTNVANLAGGLKAWREAGYPVEEG